MDTEIAVSPKPNSQLFWSWIPPNGCISEKTILGETRRSITSDMMNLCDCFLDLDRLVAIGKQSNCVILGAMHFLSLDWGTESLPAYQADQNHYNQTTTEVAYSETVAPPSSEEKSYQENYPEQ